MHSFVTKASLVLLALLLNGCTLIGLGVGANVQRQSDARPSPGTIEYGKTITVIMNNGAEHTGKYRGIRANRTGDLIHLERLAEDSRKHSRSRGKSGGGLIRLGQVSEHRSSDSASPDTSPVKLAVDDVRSIRYGSHAVTGVLIGAAVDVTVVVIAAAVILPAMYQYQSSSSTY